MEVSIASSCEKFDDVFSFLFFLLFTRIYFVSLASSSSSVLYLTLQRELWAAPKTYVLLGFGFTYSVASTIFGASWIHFLLVSNILSLLCSPSKMKSRFSEVWRSGERGDHKIEPRRLIHQSGYSA